MAIFSTIRLQKTGLSFSLNNEMRKLVSFFLLLEQGEG